MSVTFIIDLASYKKHCMMKSDSSSRRKPCAKRKRKSGTLLKFVLENTVAEPTPFTSPTVRPIDKCGLALKKGPETFIRLAAYWIYMRLLLLNWKIRQSIESITSCRQKRLFAGMVNDEALIPLELMANRFDAKIGSNGGYNHIRDKIL